MCVCVSPLESLCNVDLRGGEPFILFCIAPKLLGKLSQQWKPALLLGEFCRRQANELSLGSCL